MKEKNEIVIHQDYAEIILVNRSKVEVARAKVDVEDVDKVKAHRWHLSKHGYVECNKIDDTRSVKLHRFVLDVWDKDVHIDHIEHDKTDNRKDKLRICTNQENSRNKSYARSNTGFIGVSYSKRDKVYQAHIKIDYQKKFLGQSVSLKEAVEMRLSAEAKIFGEFAPQKHLFDEYGIRSDMIVQK